MKGTRRTYKLKTVEYHGAYSGKNSNINISEEQSDQSVIN